MKPAYMVGALLAVVFLALAVYYVLPSYPHVFANETDGPRAHYTHFVLFIGLAVVSLLGARFAANASSSKPTK